MGIRKFKPTTPGRRGASVADFADAYHTQRVMEAAIQSARSRSAVPVSEIT